MEYIVHLNDVNKIEDYIELGIRHFVVGCKEFSYRQSLSLDYLEIKHLREKLIDQKLYVLVNALIDECMVNELKEHLKQLVNLNVDGFLFQDFAVLDILKGVKNIQLIYSPDTLNTNYNTINLLANNGIDGAMLAREISLETKREIQDKANCNIIVQGHGVEYMASSKRKLLTNYFNKNSMNYSTSYEGDLSILANASKDECHIYEDNYATHIVSKKQLCSLDVLNQLIDFDFIYLDSLYIDSIEFFKVVELYVKAKQFVVSNNIDKLFELLLELRQFSDKEFYHSFLFDETVYKIEDVRLREGKEV